MGRTNGASTHDGEQFCQTTLKSIHDCSSCGTDKFWTNRQSSGLFSETLQDIKLIFGM